MRSGIGAAPRFSLCSVSQTFSIQPHRAFLKEINRYLANIVARRQKNNSIRIQTGDGHDPGEAIKKDAGNCSHRLAVLPHRDAGPAVLCLGPV